MSKKKERLIILGGAGSGKDFLLRKMVEKGLKPCLKWTTRPPRILENQGIDYNFVNEDKFLNFINENKFLTYQKFNVTPENSDTQTWYYGITIEEFESAQVFIITPGEFEKIPKEFRKKCFVVYLDINRAIREKRLATRQDKNDSTKRRLDADEIDFKNFRDYDLKITDPEFSSDDFYDLMD